MRFFGITQSGMLQVFAAVLGTMAFSLLYGVPRKYYPYCGAIGGAGWLVYLAASSWGGILASLVATMAVALLSRLTAIRKRCPVTVFLITGIFPLVPGAQVYWMAYYFVTNETGLAASHGYLAVKTAFAIVLGIVFVFEIPQRVFARRRKKEC